MAVGHDADPAGELECGLPVGSASAQELQRFGEAAGFDLASGEQQDDLVGDGRAEALGHRAVVGVGGWWTMATASNPVRPQLSRAQGFLVK